MRCDECSLNAVIAAMGRTVTTSMVHGPCDRFYRALQETRAIFLLSVAATILLSLINAGLVYDNVIPTEPDYNSDHFLGIVSMWANSTPVSYTLLTLSSTRDAYNEEGGVIL